VATENLFADLGYETVDGPVRQIAWELFPREIDREDAYSQGLLGALRAIPKVRAGGKAVGYVCKTACGRIKQFQRDLAHLVRFPAYLWERKQLPTMEFVGIDTLDDDEWPIADGSMEAGLSSAMVAAFCRTLTAREYQVLRCLLVGMTQAEAARKLRLSENRISGLRAQLRSRARTAGLG